MASVVQAAIIGGATSALLSLIQMRPYRAIEAKAGVIQAMATVRERHIDDLVITEHPVDQQASITDHAYKRPARVELELGFSDSPRIPALSGGGTSGGGPGYAKAMYQKLLTLQESRDPFKLYTGKRSYDNMLIASLATTTDEKTENILLIHVACQQVIIVGVEEVSAPSIASSQGNQLAPQLTDPVVDAGIKQPEVSALKQVSDLFGGASP